MNTLVTPSDLIGILPTAPPIWLDAAAQWVRSEAQWHIAPVMVETITLESFGGRDLFLPSGRVISVASVAAGDPVTDWALYPGGRLFRPRGWMVGSITVTFTHGFDSCPADLLPVIASRAATLARMRDPAIGGESAGPFTVTYSPGTTGRDPVVRRYSIGVGVA